MGQGTEAMTELDNDGLIASYLLDGAGGGHQVAWQDIESWDREQGTLWIHLERDAPESKTWLEEKSGLDPVVIEALLTEETRPRSVAIKDGLLVILRGVNLNPNADPEDMVALRIWVEQGRVVTVRMRKVMAIQTIQQDIESQRGPKSEADILVSLAEKLVERMGPVINDLEDDVGDLEEEIISQESRETRIKLSSLRRQAVALRRHLSPQREALSRLITEDQSWFRVQHKARLREIADRVIRYIEELDEKRERANVLQDELVSLLSERMNKKVYILTVIAAVLMPLSFITGLLGMNVGGMPWAQNSMGFIYICAIMLGILIVEWILIKRLKWL